MSGHISRGRYSTGAETSQTTQQRSGIITLSMEQDSRVMNKIKCLFELGVHCYQAANFISTKCYKC